MSYDDIPRSLLGPSLVSRHPAPYSLIRVAGPDARGFLHRMCSQDIQGMSEGAVRPAAFLNAKGRLLALCHAVTRGESVWLSTQVDTAAPLAEMLERFHFSEELTVELLDVDAGEILQIGVAEESGCGEIEGTEIVISSGRAGVRWMRVHATAAFFASEEWNPEGYPPLGPDVAEALRIATVEPWVGKDSEENTLALELPIGDHISSTKGCYTGQEIVARIETYGHTNRSLCRLGIAGTGPIETGTLLIELDDGDPVGRVMSAADIPGDDCRIAFGFVPSALAESGTKLAMGESSGPEVVVL